jgi:surfeit locus 1 family protein
VRPLSFRSARRLFADRYPGRLDVAQLPGNQNADKEQNRKADTKSQSAGHIAGFGPAIGTISHHEKKRRGEAAEYGQKSKCDEVFHGWNYQLMRPAMRQSRFWLLTIAALVVAGSTFSLGQWQLRRAAQKEALQAAIESQTGAPILDNRSLFALQYGPEAVHRQAVLKGFWRAEHTVFLDNRPMNGKVGFVVVTPLTLQGSSRVILVQRGWAQRDFSDRTHLPDVPTPSGLVTVRGRIAPSPSKLYDFKGVENGRIRQNIDPSTFGGEIRMPLLNISLLQTGAAGDGLERNWVAPALGIEKHYGYALQWFGLCALVVVLYIWFQVIGPVRAGRLKKAGSF